MVLKASSLEPDYLGLNPRPTSDSSLCASVFPAAKWELDQFPPHSDAVRMKQALTRS